MPCARCHHVAVLVPRSTYSLAPVTERTRSVPIMGSATVDDADVRPQTCSFAGSSHTPFLARSVLCSSSNTP